MNTEQNANLDHLSVGAPEKVVTSELDVPSVGESTSVPVLGEIVDFVDLSLANKVFFLSVAGYGITWADGRTFKSDGVYTGYGKGYTRADLAEREGPFAKILYQLPVISNDKRMQLDIPVGLNVIIGGSGTGKTDLADKISSYIPRTERIRFGEPEAPSIIDPYKMLHALSEFLTSDEFDVCVIDSFRPMVYNPKEKSAAGAGGMNMAMFTHLTNLSIVAEQRNKTIFVVLNPLTVNTDTMKLYVEALNGSVNGVLQMVARGRFNWIARTKQSDRDQSTYDIDLTREELQANPVEQGRLINSNDDVLNSYLSVRNAALTTK